MEEYFECVFHYGGYFSNKEKLEYVGTECTFECDPERWSYWEVIGILEDKGVKKADIIDMWFNDPEEELGFGLKRLTDDRGTSEMSEIAKVHGKVHLYVDNGPDYVIGFGKFQEEVVDNEVIGEMFGEGNDDNCTQDSDRFEDSEEVSGGDDDDGFGNDNVAQEPQPLALAAVIPGFRVQNSTSTMLGMIIKPKRKKGRPRKKDLVKKPMHENLSAESSDYSLYDGKAIERKVRQIKENRGLSDDGYSTEILESGGDSSEEDIMSRAKFPTFEMPKKMVDYKWEVGTYFVTKEAFREAMTTYAVHSGKNIKFYKNDKRRVIVKCRMCDWEAYCGKIPGEDTWQLRKVSDDHTCSRESKIKLLNSRWLSGKLHSTVRESPDILLGDIQDKTEKKWNATITKCMAYRAREKAKDLVDGSFREQYTRLYDYAHELLRSNPDSTVQISTAEFIPTEEDLQTPGRPLCPYFQRMYICYKACKESFLTCRRIIGLDGCFLKGYYGGQILAAIGRDPNDQMLPIAFAVVEGETKESWTWFLKLLINDIGGSDQCRTYTFISDQQKVMFSFHKFKLINYFT
jgi:hypothetical protein